MTDTAMTSDLIQRLEEATEGSRELDLIVNEAAGGAPAESITETMIGQWLPHYTTSIDAAKSLYPVVPEMMPSDPLKACVEALKARARVPERSE